jgi:transketolase
MSSQPQFAPTDNFRHNLDRMNANLPHLAAQVRMDAIKMIYAAQSGHPGSSLSCVDIIVMLYFGGFLEFDPQRPHWEGRDFFVMSKGHGCPALYAVLAELGYFSKDHFFTFRQVDGLLQGHPETFVPGIELATGPLGQGMSVANGIALALKIDGKENKVFSLHGDGELQEGNIWEAAMTAAKHNIGNYVAIIDNNSLQIDGSCDEVKPLGDIGAKFRAFGWAVFETDGHDFGQIENTLRAAIAVKDQPAVIIAHTVKGKGVSFMENVCGWHGKPPNDEQFAAAMVELEATFAATK